MNTWSLNKDEATNLALLNNAGIESGLIFITKTGLRKSIIDATQPVRKLLKNAGIHDYDAQEQGESAKKFIKCIFYSRGIKIESQVSLYRPTTKNGDPRMWPYKLKNITGENNVISMFIEDSSLCFVNLSDHDSSNFLEGSQLNLVLEKERSKYNKYSNELLFKLYELARSEPLEAISTGSTAIGRTIETHLGIDINSSPEPDYKGIEIKSSRSNSNTRDTLFAKVADWDLSKLKSSREILERFGYDIEGEGCRKLYCTVNSRKPNSQGLLFDLDLERERLEELFSKEGIRESVCVWRLSSLHKKLLEKHPETFWIKAKEIRVKGKIHFILEKIKHTRKPSALQFNRLLGAGEITMDHLIKRTPQKLNEKGPLFKIRPSAINELFMGTPQEYDL